MLLAVDIGNTNINFGLFSANKIKNKFFISRHNFNLGGIKKKLAAVKIDGIIVCSVVPRINKVICAGLKKITGIKPLVIGEHINVPIVNRYRNPKQVGQDRLVNAYAATFLHKAPLIVVDFGTAVTFDVISIKKEYLGGMILPGLGISLEAMNKKTALLPKVKLTRPREVIGRDTKSSMTSGIVFGFAALTDNLVEIIKEEIGKDAKVIATGGDIDLIGRYCDNIDLIDRDLTIKGLIYIYRRGA